MALWGVVIALGIPLSGDLTLLLIECFFQSKYSMPFLRLLEYSYASGIVNSYCILIPSCLYLCKLNEVVSSSPKAPSGADKCASTMSPVLVPQRCKNKGPQTKWLIMTSLFSRCSGGQRSKIKVRVLAGRHSPWRLSGRIPLCLLELLVVAAVLSLWPCPSVLWLCLQVLLSRCLIPSSKDTSHWI